jgi:hypothetical protein
MAQRNTTKGGSHVKDNNRNTAIISCNVCQDLIPLVKDAVASEDSQILVHNHIQDCKECQSIYGSIDIIQPQDLNDQRNIKTIRKHLYTCGVILILLGTLLGIGLTNSMGMFYNIILMPLVGATGYVLLKHRWMFVPITVFILSYLWILVGSLSEWKYMKGELFTMPLFFSFIYTILTFVGIFTGFLLKFAFKKERIK